MSSSPKVLLLTGASSDIGLEIIRHFSTNYDKILAHYHHESQALQQLIETSEQKIIPLQADFSTEGEAELLVKQIREYGLVPNHIIHLPASSFLLEHFPKKKWEQFQKALNVSLRSITIILQSFLKEMGKLGNSKVIFMLSDLVVYNEPSGYVADYVVSKYALLGLLKALASEYRGKGVTINGISPTVIDTKFLDQMPQVQKEMLIAASPGKRALLPFDCLGTIEFLLSDQSSLITGQNISIR